jgi:hypothetical protein
MIRHLIHIGYPKTGSTFLQRWFATHPQLAFADGGLAGFRDVYALVRACAAPPPADVLYRVTSSEGLSAPRASAGQSQVDFSEGEWDMPSAQAAACALVAELFPNAVVLIVTRGFRSMILSSYSQYVRAGGGADLRELIATSRTTGPWNYDQLIGFYTRTFGAANVIVMPYELLRDDADRFMRTLETRLGLRHVAASPDRVNTALSEVELYWYPRLTRFVRKHAPRRVFTAYARAAFTNRLRLPIRVLQRLRPAAPVSADDLPESHIEMYRGFADSLRDNPLYAPYASDYLLSRNSLSDSLAT